MKKLLLAILTVALACGIGFAAVGCSEEAMSDTISVITREDGSGTRGAFVELTGVQAEVDGEKVDRTTTSAEVANSTSVVIQKVKDNKSAIGYVSLGSLTDDIKAVPYEGVQASVENIKNGTYKLSRPFNVAYKADNDNATLADFLKYIKSPEAKTLIESEGYIGPESTQAYTKPETAPTEELVINGSSSVHPLMEKLVAAYCTASGVAASKIKLGYNDSTSGMNGAMNGTYDLGMASRELKAAEAEALTGYVLATDGIAVVVNKSNPVESLTKDQISKIYIGEAKKWSDVGVDVNEAK